MYDQNPGIGSKQLYIKALKDGLDVNKRVVEDFHKRQGDKQVFQQRKTPNGETAPKDESEAQVDLIDMKAFPSGIYKHIIILVNVFTRKAYLKPITKKTPDVVERGLKTILDRAGPLKVISSDQGIEWSGKVAKLLENRNIAHRLKATGDRNAIAVVDRTIQTIRTKLSKVLTKKNKTRWDSEIQNVQDSYNNSSHGHLIGEEPGNVPDMVKYELLEQSAEAIKRNNELNEKRTYALLPTMRYRAPLPRPVGLQERGFKPKFGQIRVADRIEAGLVTDVDGNTTQIKQVQVVPAGSTNVNPPDFGSVGQKKKPQLQRFADMLKPYLQRNGPTSLTTIGKLLNQETEFKETKANLTLLQFIKLFPMFKTTGKLSATKVELR